MNSDDFEVHPIVTGRTLAELSDQVRDLAAIVRALAAAPNLSASQKMAARGALARADQPIR